MGVGGVELLSDFVENRGTPPPPPHPLKNDQKVHFLKKWFLDPQKRAKSNEEAPQKKCQNPYKIRILH